MTCKSVADENAIPIIEGKPQLGEMLPTDFQECRSWAAMISPGKETLKWSKEAREIVILLDSHTMSFTSPQRTGQ